MERIVTELIREADLAMKPKKKDLSGVSSKIQTQVCSTVVIVAILFSRREITVNFS